MKFKTFVITKRKLTAIALSVVMLISGTIAARLLMVRSVAVFNAGDAVYENILSEQLPDDTEKHIRLDDIVRHIIGFDIEAPETIISEYSTVFEGTTSDIDAVDEQPENAREETREETETAQENDFPDDKPIPDGAQISSSVGLKLNNATNFDVSVDELCAGDISLNQDGDGPLVLIVHTHTTECYNGDEMSGETERNTDEKLNVVAVGEEIRAVLEENGIGVIHDATYHDYPSYQGSYSRALKTIEGKLKENPTIKVVLDVHRDAFIYPDGSKLTVSYDENGISTAQVMLVVGTNSMGLWHDNWRDNLTFAAKIQNAAEIMYPGLMRPINLRTERFNEHLTRGSLILEVGSNGNTLDEAKMGGREVAKAIAAVLNAK